MASTKKTPSTALKFLKRMSGESVPFNRHTGDHQRVANSSLSVSEQRNFYHPRWETGYKVVICSWSGVSKVMKYLCMATARYSGINYEMG